MAAVTVTARQRVTPRHWVDDRPVIHRLQSCHGRDRTGGWTRRSRRSRLGRAPYGEVILPLKLILVLVILWAVVMLWDGLPGVQGAS